MLWVRGFGWEWMIFGSLLMLLFWGGLIALAVFAIRALTRSDSRRLAEQASSPGSTSNGALEILKERYARGEITKDQYESMRRDLMI